MVMPGHSENLTAASAITSDVAGVAIVGLGSGSLRPTFNWTTADTATWVISAANCSFSNLIFNAKFADVAIMFDVSAVEGVTFEHCEFKEDATNLNWVIVLDFATGASDVYISDCRFIGGDAANDNCLNMVALSKLHIKDSYFAANVAQTAAAALINATGAVTNTWIHDVAMRSNVDGALFIISDQADNSGVISNVYLSSIDTAGAVTAGFNWTGAHAFELYVAGEADSFGLVGGGAVYNNA
jgi:hypothetical protein